MKYYIVFLFIVVFSCKVKLRDDLNCKRVSNSSLSERMKHYPFSKAARIDLIAFEPYKDSSIQEQVWISIYLHQDAGKKYAAAMLKYISSLPYVIEARYISSEKAMEKWNDENDTSWKKLLESNPLPESIELRVKVSHFNKDSLQVLDKTLLAAFPKAISTFQYPSETITKLFSDPLTSMINTHSSVDFPILYPRLLAKRTLNISQTDSLTDILYNYGVADSNRNVSLPSNYDPQNAIIFYDSEDNAFEFIEICFKCGKMRTSKNVQTGNKCRQTFSMLEELFNSVGALKK
jgi:hypothetical protein